MSWMPLVILGLFGTYLGYTFDPKVCVKWDIQDIQDISSVLGISHQIGQARILRIVMANLDKNA